MGQRPDELRERTIVVRIPQPRGEPTPPPGGELGQHDDASQVEDTAAAREEIEHTRADMTSTIEAIQDRLDPEVLSEQAKDTAHDVTDYAIREAKEAAREITEHAVTQAREAVRDMTGQAKLALRDATIGKAQHMARTATDSAGGLRQTVVETIKANPMPAALVGLGLGWMLLNRPSGSSSQPYSSRSEYPYAPAGQHTVERVAGQAGQMVEQVQGTADQVIEQVQGTADQVIEQVQSTADQVVGQVQETGGQVVDQVQEQAARAQTFLQRQLDENPMIVGAVAVAIGGVLAGTVRSTPREDQLLGQTRDRLMGNAKELTEQTMEKVGRVVDEAQQAAKQEAREQSLVPEGTSQGSTG